MNSFKKILSLTLFNCQILRKKKLSFLFLVLSVFSLPLFASIARSSFVTPERIFWDFVLSYLYLVQIFLAGFFLSHSFFQEKTSRSLLLLKSSSVNSFEWLSGQLLGYNFFLFLLSQLVFLLALLYLSLSQGALPTLIVYQAQFLASVEVFVFSSLILFLSLYVRPLFAWIFGTTILLATHSVQNIQKDFLHPEAGKFIEMSSYKYFFSALDFFPPFPWLNLRDFVPYVPSFSFVYCLGAVLIAFVWSCFFLFLSTRKLNEMDL